MTDEKIIPYKVDIASKSIFPQKTSCLELLSSNHDLELGACRGDDILKPGAVEPFEGMMRDFMIGKACSDGKDTPPTKVAVYGQTKDKKSTWELFKSFGVRPEKLLLSHGQIKDFKRRYSAWLNPMTYFLFESNGRYFAAASFLKPSRSHGLLLFQDKEVGKCNGNSMYGPLRASRAHQVVVPETAFKA